jgi:hypothetical protein
MPAGRPLRRTALALPALLLALASCASAPRYAIDGARAQARVEKQVAFGPRVPGTPAHDAMVAWLTGELRRLGGQVEIQSFADPVLGAVPVKNVLASWKARAGVTAPRRIVLAAHYDTRPWSDQEPDTTRRDQPIPGANDGGSGVAVLLEVAELLAKRPAPCDVQLVFFDAEDQGHEARPDEYSRGALGYAHRVGADRPVAVFLFDMVGDKDLDIHPEGLSASRASSLVDLVWEGARVVGATGFKPGTRHTLTDDHVPLLDAGIPAVDIIDFDYAAWHTQADRPDQVSPASLAQVARVAAWLVYDSALARGPR